MRYILTILMFVFLNSCVAVPTAIQYGLGGLAVGYVTSEVIDDGGDTVVTTTDGDVIVTNEAAPLPETPLSFLAFLIQNIYKVIGAIALFWFFPSPMEIKRKWKQWRLK